MELKEFQGTLSDFVIDWSLYSILIIWILLLSEYLYSRVGVVEEMMTSSVLEQKQQTSQTPLPYPKGGCLAAWQTCKWCKLDGLVGGSCLH